MSVEFREGDLFKQDDLASLGHGVNCRGVMGAGIARPFSKLDPAMYAAYKEICYNGELRPGDIFPWKMEDGTVIYNIASQDLPGANATYSALGLGLYKVARHALKNGINNIGIPRIGCGIGGLEWDKVRYLITEIAAETNFQIVVVTPKENIT